MEVAPLAGARIETLMVCIIQTAGGSLPSRERELKRCGDAGRHPAAGRSPRGSAN